MASNIDNMISLVRRLIKERMDADGYKVLQGTWLAAESEDSNLSSITIQGLPVRWARKCEHVTGLSIGDQVLCLKGPDLPVTIIGVVVGDITVAGVPEI